TSFTGRYSTGGIANGPDPEATFSTGLQPWSKAGIIITATGRPGAAYAAVLVTGSHGVRMQDNYTGDRPGHPGLVTPASPRWLRLTRTGTTVTGYDSLNGTTWTKIAVVHLSGLPGTVQAGLFTTSPDH